MTVSPTARRRGCRAVTALAAGRSCERTARAGARARAENGRGDWITISGGPHTRVHRFRLIDLTPGWGARSCWSGAARGAGPAKAHAICQRIQVRDSPGGACAHVSTEEPGVVLRCASRRLATCASPCSSEIFCAADRRLHQIHVPPARPCFNSSPKAVTTPPLRSKVCRRRRAERAAPPGRGGNTRAHQPPGSPVKRDLDGHGVR